MLIIAHRGNLNGPNPNLENRPDYILSALAEGYDAEIDVWCIENQWFLGHDAPQYHIPLYYLFNNHLWCHAKNIEAFERMLNMKDIHCFWHDKDDYTLTSQNYIWCNLNFYNKKGIILDFNPNPHICDCKGMCLDYPKQLIYN